MRRISLRILAALAVSVAALLAIPGAALAEGPDAQMRVTAITVEPAEEGQVAVSATVVDGTGEAVRRQDVQFYLDVDYLGTRQAYLGSARTNSAGVATLLYNPTSEGMQRVVVRPVGSSVVSASEAMVEFEVSGVWDLDLEPLPLGLVREWTPVVVGWVLMGVWGTMGLVLFRVIHGIIVMGRRATAAGRYSTRISVLTPRSLRR